MKKKNGWKMGKITLSLICLALILLITGCSEDGNTTGPSTVSELYLSKISWEDGYEEFIYNSEKNVERYNSYYVSDGLSYTLYDYNSSNQITNIDYYNNEGNFYYHKELYYEGDLITESRGFESNNEEYSLTIYEYEGNNIINIYRYSDSEYPVYEEYYKHYTLTYNSQNNVTNVEIFNSNDEKVGESDYEYDNKNSSYFNVNTFCLALNNDFLVTGINNVTYAYRSNYDEEENIWYESYYEWVYEYNDDDFPINVIRTVTQNNELYSTTYIVEYIDNND